jgi:hypothetical protein
MTFDLRDPQFVSYLSPHAEWKRELIRHFARKYQIPGFIETGTCWGTTVGAVLDTFQKIMSVEVEPSYHNFAKKKYGEQSNVLLLQGSSSELLYDMIKVMKNIGLRPPGTILYWLDAHITGGTTINLGDQVASELETINRLDQTGLVLIDDVKPEIVDGKFRGYQGPDAPITIPSGWRATFLSGVLVLDTGCYPGLRELPDGSLIP